MRIGVIDGQGGGIGKAVVEKLLLRFPGNHEIIALGTNSQATTAMLKAGADKGATGESAIVYNALRVDIIIGAVGIIASGSMMGELSEKIAAAVSQSDARKILIPMDKCKIEIAGTDKSATMQKLILEAVKRI